MPLPNGNRQSYVFERAIRHGGGIRTWIGRGTGPGANERAIITHAPSGTWGWMSTAYGQYRLYPGEAGADWLARAPRLDLAPKFAGGDAPESPLDPPELAPLKGRSTSVPSALHFGGGAKVLSDVKQVDVMFIYTRDLAQKLGANLMPMMYNLIASANQAYIDSDVSMTLRLVNATMLDLPNTYGSTDVLNAMGNGSTDTSLNTLFQPLTWAVGTSVRDQVAADVVALLRDGPDDTGGIGFMVKNATPYPTVSVSASYAYSVSNFCASGCETIVTHEIGHNMGDMHDRATVAFDSATGAVTNAEGVFSYSYGMFSCTGGNASFSALTCDPSIRPKTAPGGCSTGRPDCAARTASDFGTVMSYFYPQILRFSNPTQSSCSAPGGSARACGVASVADNALSMNMVRQNVSAYRNQVISALPGSLQFDNLGYSGSESSGSIVFHVTRTSGSSGAVSVQYAASNGTALAGADFAATSGTLTWADGDSSTKTITIPLTNDGVGEGTESFFVTLSNATGATGVYIGYPATALGLLTEPWPVGSVGAKPAGFTDGAGSSAPWAIDAIDPSGDGDGSSLKSGALDFATRNCSDPLYGAVPCPSIVQYTGNFNAGTLAFAYRVSAYPDNGFLEFLVDGAVVFQATGDSADADSGWQYFSTELTAGVHTLAWQYRTRFSFACKAAVSTGPGADYPSCQDRAWIDEVSLPLVPTTPMLLSASPSSVNFGGQSMNTTAPSTSIVFTNTSGGTITPTGASVTSGYSITANTCTAAMAPSGTCTVSVAFTPGAQGVIAGSLTLAYPGGPSVVSLAGTGERSLVTHYYRSILRRAPDQAGHDFWESEAARVAGLGASVNEAWYALALSFFNSPEYANFHTDDAGYLNDLYLTFFNRAPDVAGFDYWLSQMAQGMPRDGVLANFMFSPEFANFTQAIFGSPAVRAETNVAMDMYRGTLARLPDSAGFNFYLGQFRIAQCQGGQAVRVQADVVSSGFLNSPEYGNRHRTNGQYMADLYNTFMRRGPDLAGIDFYIGQLDSGAQTREQVRQQFLASQEFTNRVTDVVNAGCLP